MNHKTIIMIQAIFLIAILSFVYLAYPKARLEISGNSVKVDSLNAEGIIISENSDFSNARYIEIGKSKKFSIGLKPGKYYWKASNNLIDGMKKEIVIRGEVGLGIEDETLVNIGNVKVNVTKNKQGVLVGHIILEPGEQEKAENLNYEGRQHG